MRQDVSDPDGWAAVVEAALSPTGRIDVLVNAAGIEGDLAQAGLTTSYAEFRRVLSINLDGTFLACTAVMPHMIAAGTGPTMAGAEPKGWSRWRMRTPARKVSSMSWSP